MEFADDRHYSTIIPLMAVQLMLRLERERLEQKLGPQPGTPGIVYRLAAETRDGPSR